MALKRELGLWEIVLAGVGVIVGAGIYALLGKGAGLVGDRIWLSFAIGGFIALMTSLSYSELASRYPKAGAEYVYAKNVIGEKMARLVGFALLFVGFTSATTVALGFGGYLHGLFNTPILWGALSVILLSGFILLRGAKFTTDLASGISIIEVLGLLVVVTIGLPTLVNGFGIPAVGELPNILFGTAVVFFAFLGFEELVRMSEETKKARTQMPKALIAAVAISSVLYVLVSASAVGLVGADVLGKSTSPLATVVRPSLGENGFFLMSLAGLLSTFNTVLLIVLASSRLLYGMSIEKTVPIIFSKTRNSQPVYALGIAVVASLALLVIQDITTIAQMTDALLFAVFAIMNLVIIKIHWDNHQKFTGFNVPFNIGKVPIPAVFGLVSSMGMLLFVEWHALAYSFGFFVVLSVILHILRPRGKK
ncbi:MAG: amino acid permease [Candidatus Diapherotrites archaeon]|uniref:Amino acid permease n=1 Tax=Candidatus Iainarchaeum sp. TaxID=3101447 RepID=A0A8T4C8E3_9ARCH|nr:amino acid permease [Candidatus Diapherotrites archaeon]